VTIKVGICLVKKKNAWHLSDLASNVIRNLCCILLVYTPQRHIRKVSHMQRPMYPHITPATQQSCELSTTNHANYASTDHGINTAIPANPNTAASIMKERKESQQHKESAAAVISNLSAT
jgi:hypothetical protein